MPAHKPVRRGQLISPFGIGAMVDFPRDESLMPAGLDAWPFAKQECPPDSGWLVREERLEARMNVRCFRLPPDHRERDTGSKFSEVDVPFVRFPRWHYCHHCGAMEELALFSSTRERCPGRPYPQQSCEKKPEYRRPFLIPVRFVAACETGHIRDFPFMEWVHRDTQAAQACRLRLRAGRSSAGLSGITIECSCGQKRNLGDVFRFDPVEGGPLSKIGCLCQGWRPWLGITDGDPGCGQHLRVLQRGATNVYFPQVVSSIYLPLWAEKTGADVIALLEQPSVWAVLSQGTVSGKVDPVRCQMAAALGGVDPKELETAAQLKMDGRQSVVVAGAAGDEESFRRSEYQAICDGKVGPQTELYVECAALKDYEPEVAAFFSRIRLVHKLRETRALAGFTRILPPDGNLSSPRRQSLRLDPAIDWLPAIKVYGEGIFLELDLARIKQWLRDQPGAAGRIAPLAAHYNSVRVARQQPQRNLTPKFILLHTLAHVLINQLSFDCGYGSASLRERVYCDFTDPAQPMHGILIYTASGDSEGTMGGLVRQGKPGRFEATLRRALIQASWCSSDPVCIESPGQGSDSSNLAACHGCCLLPETSCEEGNRLLDRAMLVGKPETPALGFFNPLLPI
ncbi:MAG: DrmB family protein [Opitutales bacterium]